MFTRLIILLLLVFTGCSRPGDSLRPPADVARGKEIYATCVPCHGANAEGNPIMQAPALANLEDWYLQLQLQHFHSGVRGAHPKDTWGKQMAAAVQPLDTTHFRDVVAYIKSFAPTNSVVYNSTGSTGEVAKGARIYETICGSCHGPGGKGNKLLHTPTLKGLPETYLIRQLQHFQQEIRGGDPRDVHGAQMVAMARMLKDSTAVVDVVAYLTNGSKP